MSKISNNTNSGISTFNIIETGALFVNGKRFKDIIQELISEDQLEQGEIDDLRNLLTYLNTSALTEPWIVNNENRNATLKSLITAIETKLQNIDTTALSQSSVLTDDNRNSVLKSRLDSNDSSLTDLSNKTRYILTSSVGNNSAIPKTANTLLVSTNNNPANIHKSDLQLLAGLGQIRIKHDTQTIGANNYTDNVINIQNPGGMISSDSRLNRMMASDKIEIGNLNLQSSIAINIGGKGSQINIGSIDTPEIGQTNTIIQIGKRTQTRNTETYLQGNIYTNEARFEDLPVTTGITLANIYSLLSGSAPSYILGAFVSVAGGFNYSDILHMNLSNPLQKNKDITTSKGITIDSLKIFDSSPISVFPKISTYFVNGDIVSTQVVGQNTTSVFSGQIKLENHNTLSPLNINWALSANDERVNVVDIKGDDGIFIHQGASTEGKPLQIMNSCNGGIELRVGGTSNPDNRGLKSEAVGGLFLRRVNQLCASIVKEDPDIIPSFKRKTNNPTAQVDYRLLVSVNDDIPQGILSPDGLQQNHGIVVINEAKHHAIETAAIANLTQPIFTEYTAIDEDNITTPSLTFLGTYAGTTTNTLYKNANNDLMYNGEKVAVGSIPASSGGLTYIISAPSNTSITHANQVTTNLTMSPTYTTATIKTATLSAYNTNTNYQIVSIIGAIPKSANPILSGTYELNQFVSYSANVDGSLYAKLYFTGLPLNNVLINKTYIGPAGSGNTLNLTTPQILVPVNDVSITISKVTFPSVSIGGPSIAFPILTLTLVDQTGTILYTFPTQVASSNTTFDKIFTPTEGSITITDTTNIKGLRFNLQIDNSTGCVLNQTVAQDAINARYILEGSIRMLLYDGTSNPTTLTPNAVALYALSIPLPTTPFVITDYLNPNITLEEWFIQPTGTATNHTVSLRFNDGALSHFHTSIASVSSTPTLSSVMTAGNSVGNTDLNMNGQDITNADVITANTITPTTITGFNVKQITAGSNISVNIVSGNYTISTPTQTLSSVMGNGAVAPTNLNMNTHSITNCTAITATTVNATNIPNWNVKQITAGSGGIVVSSDAQGTYTISNDAQVVSGQYLSADYDYPITATSAITQKPSWYGHRWSRYSQFTNTNIAKDIYMSANGKYTVVATNGINLTPTPIFYSNTYALNYQTSALTKLWQTITGTADGSTLWAIQSGTTENGVPYPRELWRSLDFGATWSQQTNPPDFANAVPHRIRVSSDGKYQLISDGRATGLGKLYRSTNYGVTWTSQNLTTTTAKVDTIAISSNGAVQYVELSSTTGAGGIYRSVDYGANFNRINTTDPIWNISCDATGRIVAATTNTGVLTSRDYGQTWKDIAIAGATAITVSSRGDIIWIGCITRTATTELYSSDDYGLTFQVRNGNPFGSYLSTNYISIVTNNDGTIIVGGGSQNLNWFTEGEPDVKFITAGTGISVTTIGSGAYSISSTVTATNDYQWFASGSVYVPFDGATNFFNIDWASTGKIDLVAYDIKYEIEIHWDANTSTTTAWPYAFIEMGLNRVYSIDGLNQGIIMQSATNWTNLINSGPWGANTEYNQSYAGRFFAGFSQQNNANGGGTPPWRYKTLLSGHLNYTYRTVSQSGITDLSPNGRLIQNHFTCDSFLQQTTVNNTWGIWYDGAANDAHTNRIHGSALWDTSMNGKFTEHSGTNEALSQGIYRIALRLHEGFNIAITRPRGAQILYKIYRIKK